MTDLKYVDIDGRIPINNVDKASKVDDFYNPRVIEKLRDSFNYIQPVFNNVGINTTERNYNLQARLQRNYERIIGKFCLKDVVTLMLHGFSNVEQGILSPKVAHVRKCDKGKVDSRAFYLPWLFKNENGIMEQAQVAFSFLNGALVDKLEIGLYANNIVINYAKIVENSGLDMINGSVCSASVSSVGSGHWVNLCGYDMDALNTVIDSSAVFVCTSSKSGIYPAPQFSDVGCNGSNLRELVKELQGFCIKFSTNFELGISLSEFSDRMNKFMGIDSKSELELILQTFRKKYCDLNYLVWHEFLTNRLLNKDYPNNIRKEGNKTIYRYVIGYYTLQMTKYINPFIDFVFVNGVLVEKRVVGLFSCPYYMDFEYLFPKRFCQPLCDYESDIKRSILSEEEQRRYNDMFGRMRQGY